MRTSINMANISFSVLFRSFTFAFALVVLSAPVIAAPNSSYISSDPSFTEDAEWMRARMGDLVESNKGTLPNGKTAFYADALRHYNLIFTRGFGYIYAFADDLIEPEDAKGFLEYLLAGQRADGCIPDRVNSAGRAIYSPGGANKPLADHALDNSSFLASAVCRYVVNSGDIEFFREHEPALRRGMDFINRASNGLVFNPTEDPQCVYGFTDIVKKTGHILFTSVLYHNACVDLETACRKAKVGDPDEYARRAQLIKKNIGILWDRRSGAFMAADGLCKQYDVWGTAFVLHSGLATSEQEEGALDFLVNNYSRYAEKGQIRHILSPETWQSTFVYRPEGVYQNGAYWATPLNWFIPVLARRDPELAQKALGDCLRDFRERGIHEWVNGGVTILPNYFVSAASVYSLLRLEGNE
ncbi:MAG: hypothetical protein ACI92G_004586 [Candidatus Pelagisphaera sp.]|jgi:hypothetical protein